ncbi:MAG: amidohydrolase [Desulfobacterales bacterium]|nr:amidohydrolase [Desulfobacterales bacterium]
MYDLLIHGGTFVTLNPARAVLTDAWLAVRDGAIAALGPCRKDLPLPAAAETIDAKGGMVMPGLVNAHTHLPMILFRGLADDLPLMTWLNDHIFPAEAAFATPENVHAAARLACAELLLGGVTTCCDGYFWEDRVAAAVNDMGLRAVLGQGVVDFPAPGVDDPSRNLSVAQAFVDRWADKMPTIAPSIFCHAPYTCGPETLREAKAIARAAGILFQIHAAETRDEVRRIQDQYGRSPVAHLDHLGLLDPDTLLVHAVWMDADDIARAADAGAGIVHCPESNMKLGAGIAPLPRFLESGLTVGLGTDGCASNNNQDLFREMDMAAKLHKLAAGDPTVVPAATALQMATIDGARAIGLGEVVGSLEVGKRADIIILDSRHPRLRPMFNPVSQAVYAAGADCVCDTIVDGRIRVRHRDLVGWDLETLIEPVASVARVIAPGAAQPIQKGEGLNER